jgi:glucokinase
VSRAANIKGFEKSFALGPAVSKVSGRPTFLDNDVRAAMFGELVSGAGRRYRDMLGVFLGTGVGGGVVLDRQLRHGRGAAGEIGHVVVLKDGRRCACGRFGCLEAYAGRGSMETQARLRHKKGEDTVLFKLMEQRKQPRITSGIIARALDADDHMAKDLIDDAVWALGVALASAQNLLDMEAIIVGGGLGDRLGEPFVRRVEQAMAPHLFVADRAPRMINTELGDLSGAVGAALMAAQSALM